MMTLIVRSNAGRSVAALLAMWVLLAGCGASSQDNGVKTPLPRQGNIRVVNAIPDSGSMSSFLSNSVFGVNQYGESTDLRATLVGQYVMNILLTPPNDVNTVLVANEPVNLTDPDDVSFYLIGPSSTPQEVRIDNTDIAFNVNLNNPASFPPPDYQVLHAAATSVGAADIYVYDANTDINTVAPTATLSFGQFTQLAQLDSSITYRLQVTAAGSKTVLYDSGGFTQANMNRSTYMLLDNYGSSGIALRVANITATAATNFTNETLQGTLRATNDIPDAPSVDVYVGATTGTPVFTNVAYGTTTPYLPVANGTVTVNVTPAGTPGTTIATKSLTFVGGQARGLYTSGLVATTTGTLDAFIESQRPITGQAQLRFVDAAPSAGSIDVYLLVPGQSVGDVSPIVSGGGLLSTTSANLTPGSYDIAITRSGTTVQLFGPDRIVVADGGVYSSVLMDAAGGGPPLSLQVTQETIP
jgi:hypothetical protein